MSSKSATPHVEQEAAGFILGNRGKRHRRIEKIWNYIKKHTDHFRAPKHEPESRSSLLGHSNIKQRRTELDIKNMAGRHIFYLDTLDLAFRASGIQLRIEERHKKKGDLKRVFTEVTVKVGDKATSRLEEKVEINLDRWREAGFWTAFEEGIKTDIKNTSVRYGKNASRKRDKVFSALKTEMKGAYEAASGQDITQAVLYNLIHLNRNSAKTVYSPYDHSETELEVKTDDCSWENILGPKGEFAQIEIEHLKGNTYYFARELQALMAHEKFGIKRTNASKEDLAMQTLETALLPKNGSKAERERVRKNRNILENMIADPLQFQNLNLKVIDGYIQPPVDRGQIRQSSYKQSLG